MHKKKVKMVDVDKNYRYLNSWNCFEFFFFRMVSQLWSLYLKCFEKVTIIFIFLRKQIHFF